MLWPLAVPPCLLDPPLLQCLPPPSPSASLTRVTVLPALRAEAWPHQPEGAPSPEPSPLRQVMFTAFPGAPCTTLPSGCGPRLHSFTSLSLCFVICKMGIITAPPGLSRGFSEKVRAKRPVTGLVLGRCQTVTVGMMTLIICQCLRCREGRGGGGDRRVLLSPLPSHPPPPPPQVMSNQHFLEDESSTVSDSWEKRPWSK